MDTTSGPAAKTVETITQDEEPSNTVIMAVAETKGVDPLDLEPLYHVIDTDALDRIFAPTAGSDSSAELSFTVADCQVVVRADGDVVVTEQTESDGSPAQVVSLAD